MAHRFRNEKKRIINGDVIYQSTLNMIRNEFDSQMKYRLFSGFINYFITFIIGLIPFSVDKIENAIIQDLIAQLQYGYNDLSSRIKAVDNKLNEHMKWTNDYYYTPAQRP